jgi:hypothetical protein
VYTTENAAKDLGKITVAKEFNYDELNVPFRMKVFFPLSFFYENWKNELISVKVLHNSVGPKPKFNCMAFVFVPRNTGMTKSVQGHALYELEKIEYKNIQQLHISSEATGSSRPGIPPKLEVRTLH